MVIRCWRLRSALLQNNRDKPSPKCLQNPTPCNNFIPEINEPKQPQHPASISGRISRNLRCSCFGVPWPSPQGCFFFITFLLLKSPVLVHVCVSLYHFRTCRPAHPFSSDQRAPFFGPEELLNFSWTKSNGCTPK